MRLNSDKIPLRIGATVVALLGALLIWGAWALNAETRLFTDHGVWTRGIRTQAVVVSDFGPALVEHSVNGKPYQNQTRVQDEKHPAVRGDTVPLLYDTAKPGRARVDSFDQLWLPTVLCGGFSVLLGLCSSGIGVWFFLNWKRPGAASPP